MRYAIVAGSFLDGTNSNRIETEKSIYFNHQQRVSIESINILLNRLIFHFEIEKIERAAGERIVQLLGSVVPSDAGQVFAKHQRNDQQQTDS